MTTLFVAVFVASLLGSVHCAGMCGGLVALCVGGEPLRTARPWHTQTAYHGGRLVTYSVLGALSGGFGAAIDFGASSLGFQRTAAVVAGGAMILLGLVVLLRAGGVKLECAPLPNWLRGLFQRGFQAATTQPPVRRALTVGLLTGFLPCGWLYAFVITAAGTGAAWSGAVTMAVFWAGTVPVLAVLGVGIHGIAAPLRRHLPTITAMSLVVIGVVTVLGRLAVPAYADAYPAVTTETTSVETEAERVRALPDTLPPCCREPGDDAS